MTKPTILKRLLTNFKDPYFVIKIWQQIAILGFLVGILVGATFTQNYYIDQVNNFIEDAIEQDGCFRNYMNNYYKNNPSGYLENFSSININNISQVYDEPN